MYAQIAVDIPLFKTLTYSVPDALIETVQPGHLVTVPFRNRSKTGLVIAVDAELDDPDLAPKIKPILDLVDAEPLLNVQDIEFLQFIADYYFAPIGEVVRLALPSFVRLDGMKHYALAEGVEPPPSLDEPLARAIQYLHDHGKTPVKTLSEELKTTFTALRELEEGELVEVSYEEQASVREKTERYYRIVEAPGESDRVGKKQARILELLRDRDKTSLTEIRESEPSPYSSLSGLEERGFIEVWEEEVYRDPFAAEPVREPDHHRLTAAQERALEAIAHARKAGQFRGFVLHGVTGSGKTEVYVHAIRQTLAAGRRALVLLPEIALTPQFVAVFRGYFGEAIAVLHSGLTPAEKFDQWRRIKRNEIDIVIGARSAIFAPIDDLGILVVDEEHDPSFKQEEGPRYNARDMALVRAKLAGAQVILGSATPSLESYHNAQTDRLAYIQMPERVASRPMPDVELVDLRQNDADVAHTDIISKRLFAALDQAIVDGMQSILFLNRRGFSPCVICQSCGHVFECRNCDVSLTYHRYQESLRCHHCDYSIRMPESCPECGHRGINRKGTGTEKLAEHLDELFPHARIARLDRDTSGGKRLQKTLQAFRQGRVDLLVGTQMVTKGHDFPGVVTVGVVMADLSLNFPDFRAAERTFQLLTQVAGRAGRGDDPGHVYVQTYNPEHYSLLAARHHNYAEFADQELQIRRELSYPPFGHLIAVKFEAANEGMCIQAARDYASAARRRLREDEALSSEVFMLGPAMAPLSRLKGKSRWQLLLKSRSRAKLRKLTIGMLGDVGHFETNARYRNVRIVVDVDPINML